MMQPTQSIETTRTWSPLQTAIFRDVAEGQGNTVICARAGSGKTTTIMEALRHVPRKYSSSILMIAFNKSIAIELAARAPKGVATMTLHSLGFRTVKAAMPRVRLEQYKMHDVAREMWGDAKETRELRTCLVKVASLAKGYLADSPEEVDEIMDKHGVLLPESIDLDSAAEHGMLPVKIVGKNLVVDRALFTRGVVAAMQASLKVTDCLDFDDMIWLPHVLRLQPRQYQRVFIDETQDLNEAQIELALKCLAPKGRICAVGDDRQAIYGFRGACEDAMDRVVRSLAAKVLPLSVTYRCAKAIVRTANMIVPDLTAAPNAEEGVVRTCKKDELLTQVDAGDFILSRTNAPLVGLCFSLLKAGRRANIQGRDVGARLAAVVTKAEKATDSEKIDAMLEWVAAWCASEVKRLEARGRGSEGVVDTADCLYALSEGLTKTSEVRSAIDRLFADDDDANRITLSSTHKAKGLERNRVFVLEGTYRQNSGVVEEENLWYVAVTRAKRELVKVQGYERKAK